MKNPPLDLAFFNRFRHQFGDVLVFRRRQRAEQLDIARQQGAQLAQSMGGASLVEFADSLQYWTQDNALEIDVLAQDGEHFAFNVTRCRYAELYRSLGIPELGAVLSCNRDWALIQGFNDDIQLERTQTIMEGAAFCDFRYRRVQE